ncbi:MAG: hypothetical protein QOC73_185, partial [Actinomycetota bacterium]|nr:hypothetical protein [Actinomycetota bacterium]
AALRCRTESGTPILRKGTDPDATLTLDGYTLTAS